MIINANNSNYVDYDGIVRFSVKLTIQKHEISYMLYLFFFCFYIQINKHIIIQRMQKRTNKEKNNKIQKKFRNSLMILRRTHTERYTGTH